jgi:hypothetical protein
MAQDDTTIVITANVAANATYDRQPGAGVEELLLCVGNVVWGASAPNQTPELRISLIDGTNNDAFAEEANDSLMATQWFRRRHQANNTDYWRFQNKSTSTGDSSYSIIVVG